MQQLTPSQRFVTSPAENKNIAISFLPILCSPRAYEQPLLNRATAQIGGDMGELLKRHIPGDKEIHYCK